MDKGTIVYKTNLKEITKDEDYKNIVDFFNTEFKVDIEEILKGWKMFTYDSFLDTTKGAVYNHNKNILLGYEGFRWSYMGNKGITINLGIIVHELTHAVQFSTYLKKQKLFRIMRCFKYVLAQIISPALREEVYLNDKLEVQAREAVVKFESKYGYSDLKGK